MKLSSAHVSTARVRVQLQMEYTLKGYAFDCTHTLAYAYKNEVYLGLYPHYSHAHMPVTYFLFLVDGLEFSQRIAIRRF